MSKGSSLIEVVLYISLLSLLVVGIFSSLLFSIQSMQEKPVFTDHDYELLNRNYHE